MTEIIWSKRLLNNPLIQETYELFQSWSFSKSVEDNITQDLQARYGNMGRVQDVSRTLHRRLRDQSRVMPLIVLAQTVSFLDWRDCWRLWVGATEEPFRSFAFEWLYREHSEGRYLVRAEDVKPFVSELWRTRPAEKALNDYGLIRTARDMIRTAVSLGMLNGDGSAKAFSTISMSDEILLFYSQLIADIEGAPSRVPESRLWRLAYMSPTDVHAVLLRLHQFRRLDYEVAGSLVQLTLPHKSALEFAEERLAA